MKRITSYLITALLVVLLPAFSGAAEPFHPHKIEEQSSFNGAFFPMDRDLDSHGVYGLGRAEVSRGSDAVYIDADNILLAAAGDAENLVGQPEDFSQATGYWSRVRIDTDTTGEITGPVVFDAEMRAHRELVATSLKASADADTSHYVSKTTVDHFPASGGDMVKLVFYAHQGTLDWSYVLLRTWDSTPSVLQGVIVNFDLENGVLGTATNDFDSGIEAIGGGWFKCWILVQCQETTTFVTPYIYMAEANGDNIINGTPNGTDTQIYLTGAQVVNLGLADPDSLGPEMITSSHGEFTTWDGSANPNNFPIGWTPSGADASNYVDESAGGGECRIISDGNSNIRLGKTIAAGFTAGDYLRFSLDMVDVTSGDFRLRLYDTTNTADIIFTEMGWSAAGSYAYDFQVPSGCENFVVYLYAADVGASDITVDNVSIKKLPTPSATSYRPPAYTSGSSIPAEPAVWNKGVFNRPDYRILSPYSNQLDQWPQSGSAGDITVVYSATGPDGVSNSSAVITDTTATYNPYIVWSYAGNNIVIPGDTSASYTINALVEKKTSTPDGYPQLCFWFTDPTGTDNTLVRGTFDSYIGRTLATDGGVIDMGTHWWAWMTGSPGNASEVLLRPIFYPRYTDTYDATVAASATGSETVHAIWVNEGSWPLPYHPTGSVGGVYLPGLNYIRWPMSDAFKAILADSGSLWMDYLSLVDDADIDTAGGLVSVADTVYSILFFSNAGALGTNDATAANYFTWNPVALADYRLAVAWGDVDDEYGTSFYDGASWAHDTRESFDGDYLTGDHLHLFYDNPYPGWASGLQIDRTNTTTAHIEYHGTPPLDPTPDPVMFIPLYQDLMSYGDLELGDGETSRAGASYFIKYDGTWAVAQGASENSLPYSADFSNAAWSKSDVTVVPPDGGGGIYTPSGPVVDGAELPPYQIVATVDEGTHSIYDSISVADNEVGACTVYAKSGTAASMLLQLSSVGGDINYGAQYFDIVNGIAGSTSESGGSEIVASTIEDAGGGWWKIYLAASVADGSGTTTQGCIMAASDSTGNFFFAGDGSTVQLLLAGATYENKGLAHPDYMGGEINEYSSLTDWSGDDPTGYTIASEDASNYVTEVSGAARMVSDNTAAVTMRLNVSSGFALGDWMLFKADLTDVTSGDFRLAIYEVGGDATAMLAGQNMEWTAAGTYYHAFQIPTDACASFNIDWYRDNTGATDITLDNWSVKKLGHPQPGLEAPEYVATSGTAQPIPAEAPVWLDYGLLSFPDYLILNGQSNELAGTLWTGTATATLSGDYYTVIDSSEAANQYLWQQDKTVLMGGTDDHATHYLIEKKASDPGYQPALGMAYCKADKTTCSYFSVGFDTVAGTFGTAAGMTTEALDLGTLWWATISVANQGSDYVYVRPYMYPAYVSALGETPDVALTGAQNVKAIWVTESKWALPWHPTGDAYPVHVPGTGSVYWDTDTDFQDLITGSHPGALSLIWTPLVNDADSAASEGIISTSGSFSKQIYIHASGALASYDDTTVHSDTFTQVAGTPYTMGLAWEDSSGEYGISYYDGSSWTHQTRTAYDGDWAVTGNKLSLFLNGDEPAFFKSIKVYDQTMETPELEVWTAPETVLAEAPPMPPVPEGPGDGGGDPGFPDLGQVASFLHDGTTTSEGSLEIGAASFTRSDTAAAFTANGTFDEAIGADVPVFEYLHHTESPADWYRVHAPVNNLITEQDITNAAWTKSNLTPTKNSSDPIGAVTYTFTDSDGSNAGYAKITGSIASGNRVESGWNFYLEKTTGAPTVFPAFAFALTGGTSQSLTLSVNPTTGASAVAASTGTVKHYVRDAGSHWEVWLNVANNNAGNDTTEYTLYPAYSSTLGGALDASLTGAVTAFAQMAYYNKEYPQPYHEVACGAAGDNPRWTADTDFQNLFSDAIGDADSVGALHIRVVAPFIDTESSSSNLAGFDSRSSTSRAVAGMTYDSSGIELRSDAGSPANLVVMTENARYDEFQVVILWDDSTGQMELGYRNITQDTAWVWDASPATYDGNWQLVNNEFGPTTQYDFFWIKDLIVWDESKTKSWAETNLTDY